MSIIASALSLAGSLPWRAIGSNVGMAGLNLGSDLLGGLFSYGINKKLMDRQFNYQKALAKYVTSNHHQWNTSSLKAAGLNPVLSASGGSSGGSGGSVSLPHSSISISNPLDAIAEYQAIKQSSENHDIDIANKEAQLLKTAADIGLVQSQIDNINSSTKANDIENFLKGTKEYNLLRFRKAQKEAYGDSKFYKNYAEPFLGVWDTFLNQTDKLENSNSNNSAIIVKKSSPWTNYKFKYFKR